MAGLSLDFGVLFSLGVGSVIFVYLLEKKCYTNRRRRWSYMPEISLFYGIRVTMYYDDHNPPHFHAEYNSHKSIIEIENARCIKGALPSRQLKLILAWCVLHQDELMQNWELAKDGKPLNRINPLV